MPALSALTRQKPVDVVIDLGDGDVISVTFDRNRVTPAWAQRADEAPEGIAAAIAEVVLSWDITDDAGAPLPADAGTLAQLSVGSLRELLQRMLEAAAPVRAEGNASANTSGTPAPVSTSLPASLPNGQVPSPLQAPSASPSPT